MLHSARSYLGSLAVVFLALRRIHLRGTDIITSVVPRLLSFISLSISMSWTGQLSEVGRGCVCFCVAACKPEFPSQKSQLRHGTRGWPPLMFSDETSVCRTASVCFAQSFASGYTLIQSAMESNKNSRLAIPWSPLVNHLARVAYHFCFSSYNVFKQWQWLLLYQSCW